MSIYAYNEHSRGAKALALALGIKRIKHEGSRFKGRATKLVINWGASSLPNEVMKCKVLNEPQEVVRVSNKLTWFQSVDREEHTWHLPWSTDRQDAIDWCRRGKTVVCRTVLNGHSGRGIVIASTEDQLVDAPLYVRYKKKKDEYRVHVVGGQVIDIQRKARRLDVPDERVNWQVRNHANGFIFQRQDIQVPDSVSEVALAAMSCTSLTFGAVDIIWNAASELPFVLEINTAPGLEGQTVQSYANAFERL